jgi:hypothetical protein
MRITGWKRTKLYRHLREHAEPGRAIRVSPGTLARPDHRGAGTVSDHPADRPVPPLARASARKRAYTANGTNDGTSTERRANTPHRHPQRLRPDAAGAPRGREPLPAAVLRPALAVQLVSEAQLMLTSVGQ